MFCSEYITKEASSNILISLCCLICSLFAELLEGSQGTIWSPICLNKSSAVPSQGPLPHVNDVWPVHLALWSQVNAGRKPSNQRAQVCARSVTSYYASQVNRFDIEAGVQWVLLWINPRTSRRSQTNFKWANKFKRKKNFLFYVSEQRIPWLMNQNSFSDVQMAPSAGQFGIFTSFFFSNATLTYQTVLAWMFLKSEMFFLLN